MTTFSKAQSNRVSARSPILMAVLWIVPPALYTHIQYHVPEPLFTSLTAATVPPNLDDFLIESVDCLCRFVPRSGIRQYDSYAKHILTYVLYGFQSIPYDCRYSPRQSHFQIRVCLEQRQPTYPSVCNEQTAESHGLTEHTMSYAWKIWVRSERQCKGGK